MPTLSDDAELLEDLLYNIEQRMVIPVIGDELLVVEWRDDGSGKSVPITLDRKLAEALAQNQGVDTKALPSGFGVADVIAAHRVFGKNERITYETMGEIIDKVLPKEPPEALRLLAEIRPFEKADEGSAGPRTKIGGFPLYLSTTYDGLLEKALNAAWFGGDSGTVVKSYSPLTPDVKVEDKELRNADTPVLFEMFGRWRKGKQACYAATEADLVEFLCGIQYEHKPLGLEDALKNHHLLVLGVSYPSWLARFLFRVLKAGPLRSRGNTLTERYVSDSEIAGNQALVSFVEKFNTDTRLFPSIPPLEFVRQLHAAWMERHPECRVQEKMRPLGMRVTDDRRAAFVSYPSESRAEAWRIAQQLDEMGWQVWFDRKELTTGEEYGQTIEDRIKKCAVVIVVLSDFTRDMPEEPGKPRFFRREWACALKRMEYFTGLSRKFIYPVDVSGTQYVPPQFEHLNVTAALGGELRADLKMELKQLQQLVSESPSPASP